ncbi:signal peptidase II [Metabacillus sp. GX 13764]|uniref:signal peptidase II n=1 Tax=Metabacillus kandeliae TaxID=2900151 RepID=UPI001E4DC2BF|nr:signal peptidase II [Metabacillus kandeliae]
MRRLSYILALIIIAIDQLTKWAIATKMSIGDEFPVIENFLYITSHRNRGAAWGILQGKMWFFYVVTIAVIIGIVYYIQKSGNSSRLFAVSLGLMLGGAIGNFIDRVRTGEVVDFIHSYIFSYNFPVFNVADSSLCVGVALLFVQMLLDGKKANEGENNF